MTFTYQIDEADFVSAGQLLLRTRRWALWRRVVILCSLLLIVAAGAVFVSLRQFGLAALCGAFLLLYACRPLLIGWQYRRQFRKIPALHGPRTLEAGPEGLHIVSPLSDGRFAWQVLERFAANERAFILVQQGGRVFFPISKRQLSPEQIAEFHALCTAHLPANKQAPTW